MPRPLREYTLSDWKRLRPLTHRLKTFRYRLVTQAYVRKAARTGDAGRLAQTLRGRQVLVTVAFADPQAIAWQIPLVRHYVPNALHVIVDNSPDAASADAIAAISRQAGAPYVRLPPNPWANSRSHGLALNWTWRNLVRPGAPVAFGFLDHDIFPTAPDDPFAPLSAQDCYGVIRPAGERWFLWAGFCMFRFDCVKEKQLDFGQDWFSGLDTGGGNWEPLYRFMDRAHMRQSAAAQVPYKAGVDVLDGPLQWFGGWLHEVGVMGDPALRTEKRRLIGELLAPHLAAAAQTGRRSTAVERTQPAISINARP
jgi:hypothetical protein